MLKIIDMEDSYVIVEISTLFLKDNLIGKLRSSELENFLGDSTREYISINRNCQSTWVHKQDITCIIVYEQTDEVRLRNIDSCFQPEEKCATVL